MKSASILIFASMLSGCVVAEQPPQQNPEIMYRAEPSAKEEPSANKQPSANKEPSADKEPSANKQPSANKEPLNEESQPIKADSEQNNDAQGIRTASLESESTQPDSLAENEINTSPSSQDKDFEKFAKALSSLKTLSGKFEQTLKDKDGNSLQKTEGEFKLKRPGYFFWQVSPPFEQIIIGTPDSLKVYDPDLEQLSIYGKDSMAGSPAALLSGDLAEIKSLFLVTLEKIDQGLIFHLQQKDQHNRSFESLSFIFKDNGKSQQLSHMQFTDKLGQTTEILILESLNNKDISDSAFEFIAPEGTDVLIDG